MKKIFQILLLTLFSTVLYAQDQRAVIVQGPGAPAFSCQYTQLYVDATTPNFYYCPVPPGQQSGFFKLASSTGGSTTILTNAQTGTSYTIASTDQNSYITFSNGGAIAVTLPQAGSTGFANNFNFVTCDIGAGTATITPTASTVSYTSGSTYTAGASSIALTTGQCAWFYSDNTNYFAIQQPAGGGGGGSFSSITTGANSATLTETAGGSLTPIQNGQIASSQVWIPLGLPAPTLSQSNTGGSLAIGHTVSVKYTLVSAAGETNASAEATIGTGASCTGTNQCSVTVTAPTIPAGYTGYTVYSADQGSFIADSEKQQAVSSACVNITTNCVIQVGGAGAVVPTANTAYAQPANLVAIPASNPGIFPNLFVKKVDGNNYPWLGTEVSSCDATNGPPLPCGTPMFLGRTWFSDQWQPPLSQKTVGGKNAFVVIDHQSGVGTVLTNQDRALWVNHQNATTDVSAHYSITGIQAETDINGAPTITGSPDGEAAAGSFQLQDSTTNAPGPPPGGSQVIRASYFSRTTGNGLPVVSGVTSQMSAFRPSGTYAAGTVFRSFDARWGGSGSLTNLQGIGYECTFPVTAQKYGALNMCFYSPNVATTVVQNTDWLIRNDLASLPSLLNGPVILPQLNNSTVAAMTVNASQNVVGSITASQGSIAQPSGVSCTGGASQYSYELVGVDNNGGMVPSTAANGPSTCVNPLTVGNPATIGITNTATTEAQYAQFARIDVYRTAGPMATGKIGSLTCTTAAGSVGPTCSTFSDTGLAASGSVPTINTTGSLSAFNYNTNTNCAVNLVSPAACGSAAAGAVVIPPSTLTYTINTTAVTAASRINLNWFSFASNLPGTPTCVPPAATTVPTISNISPGVSFTISLASTAGQTCPSYTVTD